MHVASTHYFLNCKLSYHLFMVHKPPGNAVTHWSLIRCPNRLNPQSNIFPISLSRSLKTTGLLPQECHIRRVLAKPFSSSCLRLCRIRNVSVTSIPDICHGRHGRRPCKFFLTGVNFYRFNAKNWQFTVYFAVITQKIGNLLCILS